MAERFVYCSRCKSKLLISKEIISKNGIVGNLICPKCGNKMGKRDIELSQFLSRDGVEASSLDDNKTVISDKPTGIENEIVQTDPMPLEVSQVSKERFTVINAKRKKKITTFILKIITFPQYLGHFLLDIFGRSDAKDTTALIAGWLLVIIVAFIWRGDISIQFIESVWRFFFPIK